MCDVAVVGSLNCDFCFYCSQLPKPGQTISGSGFEHHYGGKGGERCSFDSVSLTKNESSQQLCYAANQAVQAAKLGAKTSLVGCVGDDTFGGQYVDYLRRECNIDCSHIEHCQGVATGTACVCISDQGVNTIVVVSGANGLLSPASVLRALEACPPRVVVCQLEVNQECVLAALEFACSNGLISILNPAPASSLVPGMLQAASIICPNETELAVLCESLQAGYSIDLESLVSVEQAARFLQTHGANDVLVTLGHRGVMWVPRDEEADCIAATLDRSALSPLHVPAADIYSCAVIDTVGAGDAFIGGLGACFSKGMPVVEALSFSNKVAGYSVQRAGVQNSFASSDDLCAV